MTVALVTLWKSHADRIRASRLLCAGMNVMTQRSIGYNYDRDAAGTTACCVCRGEEPEKVHSVVKRKRGKRTSRIPNMLCCSVLCGYFYHWQENIRVKRKFIALCKIIIYLSPFSPYTFLKKIEDEPRVSWRG